MTRHYTHTGDAAALAAVNSLPSMTGEPVKALPSAVTLAQVRERIETMTPKTWKTIRDELLTSLPKQAVDKGNVKDTI